MGFQVFIERARDSTPAGLEAAARSLAQRYSFPQQLILDRLRAGRFPAWSNLDHETAKRCSTELESFGLVVSVVDEAAATTPMAETVVAYPVVTPTIDRAGRRSAPPAPAYASGLSAAGQGGPAQDLGALGNVDSWQISALDGSVEDAPRPPPRPAATAENAAQVLADDGDAEDPFAPPASEREEVELEVPIAELATTPNAAVTFQAQAQARPAAPPPVVEIPAAPGPTQPRLARLVGAIATGRGNLAAGVAVALLLGFLPAHIFGSVSEHSYDEIRERVSAELAQIDSPEAWDDAAVTHAAAQGTIESRHTKIVVSSVALWLIAFGILLYVWLRRIDWDRMAWLAGARQPTPRGRA